MPSEIFRQLSYIDEACDGTGEGFGVFAEVTSANQTVTGSRGDISVVRANKFLEATMKDFTPIIKEAKRKLQQLPPIMSSSEQRDEPFPNNMDIFMEDFKPIIEQAKRKLHGDIPDHDIIRLETDGCMIYQAPNTSPQESRE